MNTDISHDIKVSKPITKYRIIESNYGIKISHLGRPEVVLIEYEHLQKLIDILIDIQKRRCK